LYKGINYKKSSRNFTTQKAEVDFFLSSEEPERTEMLVYQIPAGLFQLKIKKLYHLFLSLHPMGCIKIDILEKSFVPMKIVYRNFDVEQNNVQRFLSIDPLADGQGQQIWSPYSAMGNAPESMIDPNGESAIDMQSMVMINGASPVWNESDAYADHNQGNGYVPPPDLEEMAAAGFEYLAEATQDNAGNSGTENAVVAVFINVVDGGSMTLANASTTDATKETGETTKSDGDQQQNGGSGNFFADNWQDVAFMANDLAQAVGNNSSLNTALRMGRPTTMLYVPPGVSIPVSTKVMSTVSKVGTPIAKAAPWVAGFAIGTDIYNNQSISWGNVYQGTVLGLSLIPGAGLIVGGLSLIAEGVSYYYTGQSISDNINQRTNVIYNFK
jgi:hypothetical protein